MRSVVFFFLIVVTCAFAKERGFLPVLEAKLEEKFTDYAGYFGNWLQKFNDEHIGKTEIGRFMHYDEMKTKLVGAENPSEGRSLKKMSMTMMPLIFHIGVTSTWMMLITILSAKSLMVGLTLLVVKIAVSAAKLAAFFTHLKHSKHGHKDWRPQWLPHFDHHESHIEHHPEHHGTISHHAPEWTPNDIPHHHFHEYKNNEFHDFPNNEIHDFKSHDFHDFKTNDFHDFKNTDFHNFKNTDFHDFNNNDFHNFNTHELPDYKTIPHDFHGFNEGFHGDFSNFPGAKKKIDTKVG